MCQTLMHFHAEIFSALCTASYEGVQHLTYTFTHLGVMLTDPGCDSSVAIAGLQDPWRPVPLSCQQQSAAQTKRLQHCSQGLTAEFACR